MGSTLRITWPKNGRVSVQKENGIDKVFNKDFTYLLSEYGFFSLTFCFISIVIGRV